MPQTSPITAAIKQICEEKKIPYDAVIETIEAALAVAYRKDFGQKNENIKVEFDPENASARVFDVKKVVTDEFYDEAMKALEEAKAAAEAAEAAKAAAELSGETPTPEARTAPKDEEPKPEETPTETQSEENKEERFDPKLHTPLSEAKKMKKDAKVDDEIRTELFPPTAYGRMAAQTAKQVIIQRLREAERETIYKEYSGREGSLLNGTIQRVEGRIVLVDLGQATAIMTPSEQISREYYRPGTRLKFYVVAVNKTPKGPEIIVSRSHPEMVKKLFETEVPEIASAAVEIRSIAREGGSRTKIAVFSNQKNIDPVGSCVGQRGTRVQTVIGELGGEKIDIIEWSDDNVKFITNALSPAKVLSLKLDDANKVATVEVKEDQVSLAIGKGGQNVRLAAKLTGWKIDIMSEEGTVRTAPDRAAEIGGKKPGENSTEPKAEEKKTEVIDSEPTPSAEEPILTEPVAEPPVAETPPVEEPKQNETNTESPPTDQPLTDSSQH